MLVCSVQPWVDRGQSEAGTNKHHHCCCREKGKDTSSPVEKYTTKSRRLRMINSSEWNEPYIEGSPPASSCIVFNLQVKKHCSYPLYIYSVVSPFGERIYLSVLVSCFPTFANDSVSVVFHLHPTLQLSSRVLVSSVPSVANVEQSGSHR